MATEVKIPEIGEGVDSVELTKLLVKAGDTVSKDQSIAELETGKAVVEVPSPAEGKVSELKIQEGSEVKPGDIILTLEAAGSSGDEPDGEDRGDPYADSTGKQEEHYGKERDGSGRG